MLAAVAHRDVVVTGAFDDMRSGQIRLLQEAAKLGEVTVLLWADALVQQVEGKGPRFPEAEREYFLRAVRFVRRVVVTSDEWRVTRGAERALNGKAANQKCEVDMGLVLAAATEAGIQPDVVVVNGLQDTVAIRTPCQERGIECRVLRDEDLRGFPEAPLAGTFHTQVAADVSRRQLGWGEGAPTDVGGYPLFTNRGSCETPGLEVPPVAPGRKRVIVTGCFDWVHSGHVRFFEEVSTYGDLYVVLGHDANLRLLKGAGHPRFPQEERRYVVSAIRYVTQALVSSGNGWLDAEPEIQRLKPDIYAVNEDGDRGGKREYCAKHGIEYLVLKRAPAPGLPRRTSTELRGF